MGGNLSAGVRVESKVLVNDLGHVLQTETNVACKEPMHVQFGDASVVSLISQNSSVPLTQPFFMDGDLAPFLLWLDGGRDLDSAEQYAVDFGANDGIGPTQILFQQAGYAGLLVEGDAGFLPQLESKFVSTHASIMIAYITPATALQLLRNVSAPMNSDPEYSVPGDGRLSTRSRMCPTSADAPA